MKIYNLQIADLKYDKFTLVRTLKKRTDQQQFGRKRKVRQPADPSAKLKELQS